jgi:hypothetical protein
MTTIPIDKAATLAIWRCGTSEGEKSCANCSETTESDRSISDQEINGTNNDTVPAEQEQARHPAQNDSDSVDDEGVRVPLSTKTVDVFLRCDYVIEPLTMSIMRRDVQFNFHSHASGGRAICHRPFYNPHRYFDLSVVHTENKRTCVWFHTGAARCFSKFDDAFHDIWSRRPLVVILELTETVCDALDVDFSATEGAPPADAQRLQPTLPRMRALLNAGSKKLQQLLEKNDITGSVVVVPTGCWDNSGARFNALQFAARLLLHKRERQTILQQSSH